MVAVFECETEAAEFRPSDSAPLHEAAVTALLFEADELRFLSAGADQKLLSTHARGRLEAEDRGRLQDPAVWREATFGALAEVARMKQAR